MRLAVITPVGPGHDAASLLCSASIDLAWAHSGGPFSAMLHTLVDDGLGRMGRSCARNLGVSSNDRADWYFFIDADDLCQPEAFERFGVAIGSDPSLVAVFGAVCTDRHGVIEENVYPLTWDGLLSHGPAGTLSMGCFVRGDVARRVRFNDQLDAGEDFDFYLRLLNGRRWTKLADPLVTIRRNVPSATGPRGYTQLDWRAACQPIVDKWKTVRPTAR